jgi:hypothetical protein
MCGQQDGSFQRLRVHFPAKGASFSTTCPRLDFGRAGIIFLVGSIVVKAALLDNAEDVLFNNVDDLNCHKCLG